MKKVWVPVLACSFFLLANACKKNPGPVNRLIRPLSEMSWQFRQEGDSAWLPATVPGTVYLDLMNNNLIGDPFYSMNESKIQWVGDRNWEYRTSFTLDDEFLEKSNAELSFEGLDTYATVYLNDSAIIHADNMFLPWNAECKQLLKKGTNELRILFRSAVNAGLEKMKQIPYLLPVSNEQAPADQRSSIFSRKAPFHYGWDWGPRFVTCGIWKPGNLESWGNARILDLYLKPQFVSDSMSQYLACLEVESDRESSMLWELSIGDTTLPGRTANLQTGMNYLETAFNIDPPILWWTNGLGEPYLYHVTCRLLENGQVVDQVEDKLGIRDLRLVEDPDTAGSGFSFWLNDGPVFMKGVNYIPSDFFSTRVTKEQLERLLDDVVAANMNMIRVWGGAIYEDELFYDLCDERGILVWQDFMFACAMPPGDSAYLENVRKEAEYQVKRLRKHPCLALWCGNNENLIAWNNWGWKESVPVPISESIWKDYEKIFYEILPQTVLIYDTKTRYLSSSPSSMGNRLPDRRSGDEHDWTIWFGQKLFKNFGENVARFVSEYGLQSIPEISTIKAFSVENNPELSSPDILSRQRSRMDWIRPGFTGNDMMLWYIDQYYGKPSGFEETIYLSQLTQALGLKTAIENHRMNMPHCMGSLYWQLDDCWPTLSWSSIDYYGNWKAAHYKVKKAFENLVLVADTTGEKILIYGISDLTAPVRGSLCTRFLDLRGREHYREVKEVVVDPGKSQVLTCLDRGILADVPQWSDVIDMRLESGDQLRAEGIFFLRLPKDLDLPEPRIITAMKKKKGGMVILLETDVVAHGVFLQMKGVPGHFSDNYFDMLPGMEYIIEFTPAEPLKKKKEWSLDVTSYHRR